MLVRIDTGGEVWRWWVTNPVTATYLERAWRGTYSGCFYGALREGPGAEGHNVPWSWHADPNDNGYDIVFFAPPNGQSPSTPSQCEKQLDHWLSKDTLFIPYPLHVVAPEPPDLVLHVLDERDRGGIPFEQAYGAFGEAAHARRIRRRTRVRDESSSRVSRRSWHAALRVGGDRGADSMDR